MLKENIYYGVEGKILASTDSVSELVKNYFLLGIKFGADNFDYITYRGHDLFINDPDGFTDAIAIEADLRSQINEANKIEDGE